MLSKKYRLLKKKDFENVFKKGKFINNKFLYFKIIQNNQKNSRFGISISKKITKKAVDRNKIKRQIRNIIKQKIPFIKKNIDLVIISKKEINEKSFTQIEENINQILVKAKIMTINNKSNIKYQNGKKKFKENL